MEKLVHIKHSKRYYEARKKRKMELLLLISFCMGLMIFLLSTVSGKLICTRLYGLYIEMNQAVRQFIIKEESEIPKVSHLFYMETNAKDSSSHGEGYEYVKKSRQQLHEGELILVNGSFAYSFLENHNLVNVQDYKNEAYKVQSPEIKLNKTMIGALNKMMQAFNAATGKDDLIIISGYRTLEEQEEILKEKINLFGEESALKWAMLPSYSEHHTGYAADISICTDEGKSVSYKGQGEYSWINENCYKYGLIRRYAADKQQITGVTNEEWHYRYIGVPHAYIVMEKGFCLEEYIEYLKQYPFDQKHLKVSCEAGKYEIYYVPAKKDETLVPVPKDKGYSISGNNEDGFIVTVQLS